jgi:hypothetical protein
MLERHCSDEPGGSASEDWTLVQFRRYIGIKIHDARLFTDVGF